MADTTILFHRLAIGEYQAARRWDGRRSPQAEQRFRDTVVGSGCVRAPGAIPRGDPAHARERERRDSATYQASSRRRRCPRHPRFLLHRAGKSRNTALLRIEPASVRAFALGSPMVKGACICREIPYPKQACHARFMRGILGAEKPTRTGRDLCVRRRVA